MASTRHVVLCADDFGLTEGVSRGILALARMGRVSATSVMTNRPWWPRFAPQLKEVEGGLGVGLHLTLTLGQPLGPMPAFARGRSFPELTEVLRSGLLGSLPRSEVAAEVNRQLDAFEAAFGRPPDFIDGHQHVHVVPGVRGELLRVLRERSLRGRVWLRDPSDRMRAIGKRGVAISKALTVKALAAGFAQEARRAGFSVNQGFSGFSPFDPRRDTNADFARFFWALGPHPVVMCHPGHVDEELRGLDPVVGLREREYAYLASESFRDRLAAEGLTLAPGSDLTRS